MGRISDRLNAALHRLPRLGAALRGRKDHQPPVATTAQVHLEEALGRWGARGSVVRPLSQLTNQVYRFERGGAPFVLRLSDSARRSADAIEAELDWVSHLHASGVPVAIPVPSEQGRFVESVAGPNGTTWNAVAFAFIDGQPPEFVASGGVVSGRIRRAGEILGRIHAASRSFSPRAGRSRSRWSDVDLPGLAAESVPETHRPLIEQLDEAWGWATTLPETGEAGFGLIHGDFRADNLLEAGDCIHAIDFDAACYSWNQIDLAHLMAMTLRPFAEQSIEMRGRRTQEMFYALVQGYSVTHRLEEEWVRELPRFVHLMDLVYLVYLCVAVKNLAVPGLSVTQMPHFAATYATAKDGHEAMRLDLLPAYRSALAGT